MTDYERRLEIERLREEVAADQRSLRQQTARIRRLEALAEAQGAAADAAVNEATALGFREPAAVRALIDLRAADPEDAREQAHLLARSRPTLRNAAVGGGTPDRGNAPPMRPAPGPGGYDREAAIERARRELLATGRYFRM